MLGRFVFTELVIIILSFGVSIFLGCSGSPIPGGDEETISEAELNRLESLGYIQRTDIGEEEAPTGVVHWDRDQAVPGYNLYSSGGQRRAQLLSMAGEVVHSWASDASGLAFERFHTIGTPPWYMDAWQRLMMLPDGDLLLNASHHLFMRLDPSSRIEFALDLPAHHDFALSPGGGYMLITDTPRVITLESERFTLLDTRLLELGADGRERRHLSLLDSLLGEEDIRGVVRDEIHKLKDKQEARELLFARALAGAAGQPGEELARRHDLLEEALAGDVEHEVALKTVLMHHPATDILHCNSIQLTPRPVAGLWPRGAILLCVKHLNMLVVIDAADGRLLWSWGADTLDWPHHASQTENDTILVFDNGVHRGFSRVLEVDPASGEIVWEYRGDPPESFFSDSRGGAQPLTGGNVLITETNSGHVFEVTRDGEVVWNFYNPDIKNGSRGAIYRMVRVAPGVAEAVLGSADD